MCSFAEMLAVMKIQWNISVRFLEGKNGEWFQRSMSPMHEMTLAPNHDPKACLALDRCWFKDGWKCLLPSNKLCLPNVGIQPWPDQMVTPFKASRFWKQVQKSSLSKRCSVELMSGLCAGVLPFHSQHTMSSWSWLCPQGCHVGTGLGLLPPVKGIWTFVCSWLCGNSLGKNHIWVSGECQVSIY